MSSHSIFDEFLQTCLTQGALSLPDSGPLAAEFALAPALKTSTVAEPRVDSALGSVVDSSGDQRVTEGQSVRPESVGVVTLVVTLVEIEEHAWNIQNDVEWRRWLWVDWKWLFAAWNKSEDVRTPFEQVSGWHVRLSPYTYFRVTCHIFMSQMSRSCMIRVNDRRCGCQCWWRCH